MQKFCLPTLALVTACIVFTPAQAAEQLKLNADKSEINFVGSKPDKSSHEGGFKKFEAEATLNSEEPTKSSLKIIIATESLWSDNEKLTAHLKAPDFFNVRKYPTAVFESTKIEHSDENGSVMFGKLTMLGETNEVKIPVETEMNDDMVMVKSKFKLDRTKWGMDYGKGKINDAVEMEVNLVFAR